MPKTKISEYSTTNASNTDIEGINIDEGCAPSGINNAIRELMVHLKEFQTGASGDPLTVAGTFVASGSATLNGTSIPASKTLATTADTNTFTVPQIISANSSSDALRITQTGAGNALVVEDEANPDSTPFVVSAAGVVIVGNTASQGTVPLGDGARYTAQTQIQGSAYGTSGLSATLFNNAAASGGGSLSLSKSNTNTIGSQSVVASGDVLGSIFFNGSDGTNFVRGAQIQASVDGTPGTNDMPGRLVFSTTADGASTPTERMRIDSAGQVAIGSATQTAQNFRLAKSITGATTAYGIVNQPTVASGVTSTAVLNYSGLSTQAASFTLGTAKHFSANQDSLGAGSAVTNQFGYVAEASLTGATNNYGFYSNIASGTGRWNFYAAGTAANYFGGDVQFKKAIVEEVYTITDGAAFEIDPSNGTMQLITLGASRTPKATNFANGESVTLMVNDGTAYTLTWTDSTFGGSGVVWKTNAGVAPTLNTTGYTVIVLWKVAGQVYGARVGDA